MNKYKYNGITYYRQYFIYNNYRIDYELFKKDGIWNAAVESYQGDIKPIVFQSPNKKTSDSLMKIWFKEMVDKNQVGTLIRDEYKIEPVFEDVLYSVREKPVGYHLSKKINRESILEKGLLPNGNPDPDVLQASRMIDSVRPRRIPSWVFRQTAVYAHTSINNADLMDRTRQDFDLYAVELIPERCWIGSEGIGGWCLFECCTESGQLIENAERMQRLRGRLYWKYSCSLEDYILNTRNARRKDKEYGLDEILIMHPVPSSKVYLIGFWDEEGKFHETENFRNFVKPSFKNSYQDILQKYCGE